MTTCNIALLREAYETHPDNARKIEDHMGMPRGKFVEAKAQQFIDEHKQRHLEHRLSKLYRPWDMIRLTDKLDVTQPWVGVEYETGYNSREAYQRVVNYLWQNVPFACIDTEGDGNVPCEITFAPVNMDLFMSDDYHMDKLLTYMNGKGDAKKHGTYIYSGTHLNASTPSYRKMSNSLVSEFNTKLHYLLKFGLTTDEKTELFGRQPYGYNNYMGQGRTKWIEFKLFHSTGDMERWQHYKGVMSRIIQLIDYYARDINTLPASFKDADGNDVHYTKVVVNQTLRISGSNLAEFLLGKNNDPSAIKVAYATYKQPF